MRAIRVDAWTTVDRLVVGAQPVPQCGDREVRICVHATPVSFALSLLIQGKYQRKPPLPFIPGNTVSGIVESLGPGATRFAVGDRVVASLEYGGFAEVAVAPEACTYAIPDVTGFREATAFNTAYNSVAAAFTWPHLLAVRPGQILVVLGAGGSVGTAGVEIGRLLGATVIGVASSETKRAWAARHGAHYVCAAEAAALRTMVMDLSRGRGADAVLDPVGGALFDQALRCLRPEGRILPIGFASGEIPKIPASLLLVKNIAVCGLSMGYYKIDARTQHEASVRALFDQLGRWHAEGSIAPPVSAAFPLERASEAFATVLDREHLGHVVLEPGSVDHTMLGRA